MVEIYRNLFHAKTTLTQTCSKRPGGPIPEARPVDRRSSTKVKAPKRGTEERPHWIDSINSRMRYQIAIMFARKNHGFVFPVAFGRLFRCCHDDFRSWLRIRNSVFTSAGQDAQLAAACQKPGAAGATAAESHCGGEAQAWLGKGHCLWEMEVGQLI